MTREHSAVDSLGWYYREIHRTPLLSHDQEVNLSCLVKAGQDAAARLATPGCHIDDVERATLEEVVKAGDSAHERLVRANLGLVVSVAKRYRGSGLDLLDLIQLGNLGLLKAAERYDGRRGFRFTTYATWWIRAEIDRGLPGIANAIRLPRNAHRARRQVDIAQQQLEVRLGRTPSPAQLANELGVDRATLETIDGFGAVTRSLDEPAPFASDRLLGDLFPASEPSVFDMVARSQLRLEVDRLLDLLDDRERTVLRLRYGLDGHEPQPLEAVADNLGVTRERARQLEQESLDKLRHPAGRRIWEQVHACLKEAV